MSGRSSGYNGDAGKGPSLAKGHKMQAANNPYSRNQMGSQVSNVFGLVIINVVLTIMTLGLWLIFLVPFSIVWIIKYHNAGQQNIEDWYNSK